MQRAAFCLLALLFGCEQSASFGLGPAGLPDMGRPDSVTEDGPGGFDTASEEGDVDRTSDATSPFDVDAGADPMRWTWASIAEPISADGPLALALLSDDTRVVAVPRAGSLAVLRLEGRQLIDVVDADGPLASRLPEGPHLQPRVAIDRDDRIVVAWIRGEGDEGRVELWRHESGGWRDLAGDTLDVPADGPVDLTVDDLNRPVLTYLQRRPGARSLRVRLFGEPDSVPSPGRSSLPDPTGTAGPSAVSWNPAIGTSIVYVTTGPNRVWTRRLVEGRWEFGPDAPPMERLDAQLLGLSAREDGTLFVGLDGLFNSCAEVWEVPERWSKVATIESLGLEPAQRCRQTSIAVRSDALALTLVESQRTRTARMDLARGRSLEWLADLPNPLGGQHPAAAGVAITSTGEIVVALTKAEPREAEVWRLVEER